MCEQDEHPAGAHRLTGDTGANLVEYSMLLALIFIACLTAVTFFGDGATGKMSCVSSTITNQATNVTC
jgi:Flp pilus assembly pilin Flp